MFTNDQRTYPVVTNLYITSLISFEQGCA